MLLVVFLLTLECLIGDFTVMYSYSVSYKTVTVFGIPITRCMMFH